MGTRPVTSPLHVSVSVGAAFQPQRYMELRVWGNLIAGWPQSVLEGEEQRVEGDNTDKHYLSGHLEDINTGCCV